MDPSVGARTPERTSNIVVFPAPLGPIRPQTSPAWRSRCTSSKAAIPPKRTHTPWATSTGAAIAECVAGEAEGIALACGHGRQRDRAGGALRVPAAAGSARCRPNLASWRRLCCRPRLDGRLVASPRAEVRLDELIELHLSSLPTPDDPAELEEGDPVGHPEGVGDLLLYHQNACAVRPQLGHQDAPLA